MLFKVLNIFIFFIFISLQTFDWNYLFFPTLSRRVFLQEINNAASLDMLTVWIRQNLTQLDSFTEFLFHPLTGIKDGFYGDVPAEVDSQAGDRDNLYFISVPRRRKGKAEKKRGLGLRTRSNYTCEIDYLGHFYLNILQQKSIVTAISSMTCLLNRDG